MPTSRTVKPAPASTRRGRSAKPETNKAAKAAKTAKTSQPGLFSGLFTSRPPRLSPAEKDRRRREDAARQARAARRWTAPVGRPGKRLTAALASIAVIASLLSARAVQVQGLDPGSNKTFAASETIKQHIIPATRGMVTDRNGDTLIVTEPAVNIVVDPTMVTTNGLDPSWMGLADVLKAQAGPGLMAATLYRHLGGSFQEYYDKISDSVNDEGDNILYAILGSNVRNYENVLVSQEMSQLGYVGLTDESAPVRLYPQGTLGANLLGYMVYDEELDAAGQYPWSGGGGIELALDANLSGTDGHELYEAPNSIRIPTATTVTETPLDGISYQLTIDSGLQYISDIRLKAAVEQHKAQSGVVVIMNVKTGEILALSNYPTFDPNDLAEAESTDLPNRALTQVYEPGSVQKLLTMAALLDSGLAATDTRIEVPGCIRSADRQLCDDWAHDTMLLTATGAISFSSNVGMMLLTRQMDKGVLVDYLSSFGLGQATGLNWPGEQTGDLPSATMTSLTRDEVAYGQGLSVTAVQMAAAVAGLVNGGTYNSPKLVRAAWNSDGTPYEVPAQTTRQVISATASADLVAMMETANIKNNRGIEGYRTAGKTGTADRYNETCACYSGTVGSYVVVAPAEDPEILVYVALDDPTSGQYGSVVAQPAATDILKVALPRLGVAPSTTEGQELPIYWE